MMNKKRSCKRCSFSLSDMDPHTICKSCRQPDPQMFYCSEEDCEACSVIKVYKPLDLFLRKQELENLAKKLNPFVTHQSKPEKLIQNKRNPDFFNKSQAMSFALGLEDKPSEVNPDILNTILKGFQREKNEYVNPFSTKLDNSYPSTSGSSEPENFKDLEKRLFDRIMSTLMTSLSSDSKSNSSEVCSPKAIPSTSTKKSTVKTLHQNIILPSNPRDVMDLNKDENELQDILVSLFATINPESLAKGNKGISENGKNDYIFKISSRASDVLLNGTVLSSPSQATKLSKELKLENEISYWPAKLNAADVLHTSFAKLPNMKLHPKVRHMHTLLFGKLNPSLPQEIIGETFALPAISVELKNECLFAREQLQRLLLMFSMVDYFCGEKVVQDKSFATLLELLLNQLKMSLEKQANFVGLLIQEIRRDLLSDAECREPEAISKLIMGPVHQTQFFGPYVKELQEIVSKKGPSYCLTSKSENANVNLFKLPPKFKEGESIIKFLNNLRVFFEANATNENDKVTIFESLLPKASVDRLSSFVKPQKVGNKSFEELALLFEKFDENNCSNFLLERCTFSNAKQSIGQSAKSYAIMLETLLAKCMYGDNGREMLRDQFIFGLQDGNFQQYLLNKFSWTFEECVAHVINQEERETEKPGSVEFNKKLSAKRKLEEKEESDPSKKLKIQEMKDSSDFYNVCARVNADSKTRIINANNLQQWSDHFGFEVNYSYEVFCPWTGQILRS